MPLPSFDSKGDLPEGVHQATMDEIIARFGTRTPQRQAVTARLLRIYNLVHVTGKLDRFIIFGSYVTAKPEPNDQTGETHEVFSHGRAQHHFGASVFWVTRGTSLANIDDLVAGWQTKRDQTRRGIVEVIG
jgi:hypothetical protein